MCFELLHEALPPDVQNGEFKEAPGAAGAKDRRASYLAWTMSPTGSGGDLRTAAQLRRTTPAPRNRGPQKALGGAASGEANGLAGTPPVPQARRRLVPPATAAATPRPANSRAHVSGSGTALMDTLSMVKLS